VELSTDSCIVRPSKLSTELLYNRVCFLAALLLGYLLVSLSSLVFRRASPPALEYVLRTYELFSSPNMKDELKLGT